MPEISRSVDFNGNEETSRCGGVFRCCVSDCGSCAGCCGGCGGCGCGSRWRAWLVVAACFSLSFLVDGVASCFGVLLPELAAQLGATIADTAWAGSALCGGQLIFGPLVGALVNKLGCRAVVIAGSLMASVAFSLSASASEVGLFVFMYGIVGGLGLGMMYLPSVVAVSIHFDTNRALATGIVVCGSGVGTFCLAPVTQHLLDVSGWRGAQLATAALLLSGVVLGAVMTEPTSAPDKCLTCCHAGHKPPSPTTPAEEAPETDINHNTDEERRHRSPTGQAQIEIELQKTTPVPEEPSPGEDFLAMYTGSYVKMTSPALPSTAGDLAVDSPSPEGHMTPPKVFLFPEVVVESASSASGLGVEDEVASASYDQVEEVAVPGPEQSAGGLHPDDALSRPILAASHSLLLSPWRRPSHHAPLSALLCPRPAVSTPCHPVRSPHTPAAGRGPAPVHLHPLQRPDVFFSGRVRPAARRLSPGGVPASPSSLPSAPAAPGCLDSDVQRRLALGSVGSMETVMIAGSTPVDRGGEAASDSFSVLKEMLDASLLRQPPFLLTCLGFALSMLGYFVPIVFILDEAVQHGVSAAHGSLLVAAMGAANTVGRLAVGVLSGLRHMDVLLLNNVSMLGSGLVALLFPLCRTYGAYAAIAAVFGLLAAANSTLSSLVLLEMVGLERLTNAFGLTLLFRGVAALLGTPLAGFVAEQTGSYDEPFYMTGALLIAASLLGFLASVWDRWSCRRKPDRQSRSYRRADSVDAQRS